MAPYLFLFLIPAITMRSFAEEKKTGTIELLFTRPISDLSIILGKYFASLTIVGFSLLPTIFYFISILK
jgi:ABC-2 type transport system permease protein